MNDQVALNKRRSLTLILAYGGAWFALLLVVVGILCIFASLTLLVALGVALVGSIALVVRSLGRVEDNVLSLLGATKADPKVHARLVNVVDGLCVGNGLPVPDLWIIDDPAVNALATRRNPREASIVVTTGLLEALDRVALEGAVAHQLARIKSDAAGLGTLAASFAVGPVRIADRLIRAGNGLGVSLLGVAPLSAKVIARVVGTGGEAVADLDAVAITRYPPGLLAALEAGQAQGTEVASAARSSAHLWFAPPLPSGYGAATPPPPTRCSPPSCRCSSASITSEL